VHRLCELQATVNSFFLQTPITNINHSQGTRAISPQVHRWIIINRKDVIQTFRQTARDNLTWTLHPQRHPSSFLRPTHLTGANIPSNCHQFPSIKKIKLPSHQPSFLRSSKFFKRRTQRTV